MYGAENPETLAKQIVAHGWRPVNAEIMVSDPIHLARTLGGRNLYGDRVISPIRELLQNAVDAVRARRKMEGRSSEWGKITLSFENLGDAIWLHIDDNGIGMSERTIVGALLDFGGSLWRSGRLQQEWPGLESKGLESIGKYGIGFFSIFLLGDQVKVASKRYDGGAADIRVLEFSEIGRRPILRSGSMSELPADCNTRVSVKINDADQSCPSPFGPTFSRPHWTDKQEQISISSLMKDPSYIILLISGVDVEINIKSPSYEASHPQLGNN